MADAAYYRAWRAAHPDYRKRQNAMRAERRRRHGREHPVSTRPSRAVPGIPPLHTGHPLFERARAIVGPRQTSLVELQDPLYDDLVSVAVVALLERKDPVVAVRRFGSLERMWGRVTAPLIVEGVAA